MLYYYCCFISVLHCELCHGILLDFSYTLYFAVLYCSYCVLYTVKFYLVFSSLIKCLGFVTKDNEIKVCKVF